MAENVMRQMVEAAGLSDHIHIDSAGTASYHIGNRPHHGTQAILAEHDIDCTGRARQITHSDMQAANTWIIAMDRSNRRNLEKFNDAHPNLHMLLDFADPVLVPADGDVPDPYYTGDFESVYQMISSGCSGLLNHLQPLVKQA